MVDPKFGLRLAGWMGWLDWTRARSWVQYPGTGQVCLLELIRLQMRMSEAAFRGQGSVGGGKARWDRNWLQRIV